MSSIGYRVMGRLPANDCEPLNLNRRMWSNVVWLYE